MVIDLNGHFVTGRQWPKMVQVIPSVSGSILTLSAPGMMSMSIDLSRIKGKGFRVAVWGQPVAASDCGEEAARWLSRFILQEDTGFRLVYYPLQHPTREVRSKNKMFLVTADDTGAYPDCTSYCLINESSITELNTRLEDPVTPERFRPNFVVKGPIAYEEDSWGWVRIGDVTFKTVRPCTRCIFTTVDPETGKKNPKAEPLKTLKSYRQITDPVIRPMVGESPVMGIHLGLRGSNGTVRLGDPVYVGLPEEQPFHSEWERRNVTKGWLVTTTMHCVIQDSTTLGSRKNPRSTNKWKHFAWEWQAKGERKEEIGEKGQRSDACTVAVGCVQQVVVSHVRGVHAYQTVSCLASVYGGLGAVKYAAPLLVDVQSTSYVANIKHLTRQGTINVVPLMPLAMYLICNDRNKRGRSTLVSEGCFTHRKPQSRINFQSVKEKCGQRETDSETRPEQTTSRTGFSETTENRRYETRGIRSPSGQCPFCSARKDWRTGGRLPAPDAAGALVEDPAVVEEPAGAAAGAAPWGTGPKSREALKPSPRLCVPATTRYTVPAALAAPSAAC
ncbi:MOSC domain-containing protein 2, mitochondrial [Melipona quadrifasciata]|uniref:MOSC domain-containing protein 2, mitochondrial n=1 Tax=Melipona quadrifasciata TaxID=166423 RepID=A0A0M8ZWA9_9HYME|nr:MOSC domain-containing protein 2, mitochondrial [Melipona quadrifasciata]